MNLTDWIVGNPLPDRPGVYERRPNFVSGTRYSYWNGTEWSLWAETVREAYERRDRLGMSQHILPFRGVTAPEAQ